MSDKSARIELLDSLRGVASLAVCLFHLVNRDGFLPEGVFTVGCSYGYLGVVVFFVISGFVVPWSLYAAGYQLCDFGRYSLKRLVRLDPPYVAAVVSVIAFQAFYHWQKGLSYPNHEMWFVQVALHIGYMPRFFGFHWLDDVYWTLGIEFQLYLLMGLIFPLLSHPYGAVRWTVFAVLTSLGMSALVLPMKIFAITYLPIFVLGIVSFYRRAGLVGPAGYYAAVIVGGLSCLASSGSLHAITAVATTLIIASNASGWGPLNALGRISYSLYLCHATLGGAIINFGMKQTSTPLGRYLVLFGALTAVFGAAVLMHYTVERPALHWSSAIRYGRRRVHN